MENQSEIDKKLIGLARRCNSDSKFRAQANSDPIAVLREEGCENMVPAGASVQFHFDDEKTLHVVFPSASYLKQPASDEGLAEVSGGMCTARHDADSYRPPSYWSGGGRGDKDW